MGLGLRLPVKSLGRATLTATRHIGGYAALLRWKLHNSSGWARKGGQPRRKHYPACAHPAADLYSVLGVSRNASKAEVKKAFHRQARQLHPDVNKTKEARTAFKAIREAYEVLIDDALRSLYNQRGLAGLPQDFHKQQSGRQQGQWQQSSGKQRRPQENGDDIRTFIVLGLSEAVLGTERTVNVTAKRVCDKCSGAGVRPGCQVSGCPICRSLGQVLLSQTLKQGKRTILGACPGCGGSGLSLEEFCAGCGGEGRADTQLELTVKVPAGVDSSSMLRFDGLGHMGRFGGAAGDIYLGFVVKVDDEIWREGWNLYSKLHVPYTLAILGGATAVSTIRGRAVLTIPAGTQHGQQLPLAGHGVQYVDGFSSTKRGAHIFVVQVMLPGFTSPSEQALLRQISGLKTNIRRPRTGSKEAGMPAV